VGLSPVVLHGFTGKGKNHMTRVKRFQLFVEPFVSKSAMLRHHIGTKGNL
jgi:hypothetical protein